VWHYLTTGVDWPTTGQCAAALAAFVLVWVTWRYTRHTKVAAEAAVSAAEANERTAREMRMAREADFTPILAPCSRDLLRWMGGVTYAFENVGKSAALDLTVYLGFETADGELYLETKPYLSRDMVPCRAAVELHRMRFAEFIEPHFSLYDYSNRYLAQLIYRDVFGNAFRTLVQLGPWDQGDTNRLLHQWTWERLPADVHIQQQGLVRLTDTGDLSWAISPAVAPIAWQGGQ
jgi:hypothetical protein